MRIAMRLTLFMLLLVSGLCCRTVRRPDAMLSGLTLVVLGNVQDGGSPHAGCKKDCCRKRFLHPDPQRKVVSLGVVDTMNHQTYLLDASPDLPVQMKQLTRLLAGNPVETPDAIFLTHAHIGHYSGLMFLGREALGAKNVAVYAMPRMLNYLETNGPWSQLVGIKNIVLHGLQAGQPVTLSTRLGITPFPVPHRDEYSETVGFLLEGPNRRAVYLPDIDKWERWNKDINALIASVDYAFLDATFYDANEIGRRSMSEVPHPFVVESMARFDSLPASERNKIWFIHLNHTNPLLDPKSRESKLVEQKGYHIARLGDEVAL